MDSGLTLFRLRADRLEFARRLFGLTKDTDLAAHIGKHRHTVDRVINRGGKVSEGFASALLGAFPGARFDDFFETPGAQDAEDAEIGADPEVGAA